MPAHRDNNPRRPLQVVIDPVLKQEFVLAAAKKCPEKSIQELEGDYILMKNIDVILENDEGGFLPPQEVLTRYNAIKQLFREIAAEKAPKLPPVHGGFTSGSDTSIEEVEGVRIVLPPKKTVDPFKK